MFKLLLMMMVWWWLKWVNNGTNNDNGDMGCCTATGWSFVYDGSFVVLMVLTVTIALAAVPPQVGAAVVDGLVVVGG